MQKTLITLNNKPVHISIPEIFDQKYNNLKFVTFSFSPDLVNTLSEYMTLQGIIGSAYNKSLTQKPNFRYAVNKVHTKVMLLSNDFGDLRVIKGSANLSNRALDQSSNQGENIEIIDNDKTEYDRWLKYFNDLWQKAGKLKQPDPLVKLPRNHALTNAQFKNLYSREANNQRQALESLGFTLTNKGQDKCSDLLDKVNGFQNFEQSMSHLMSHYYTDKRIAKRTNQAFSCTSCSFVYAKHTLTLIQHYQTLFRGYLYECFPEYQKERLEKLDRYTKKCQKILDTAHLAKQSPLTTKQKNIDKFLQKTKYNI